MCEHLAPSLHPEYGMRRYHRITHPYIWWTFLQELNIIFHEDSRNNQFDLVACEVTAGTSMLDTTLVDLDNRTDGQS
jgi:hypothetical protein